MKLLTHNLLMCNKKGCTLNNFPLKIECIKSEIKALGYDKELVTRTLRKVDLSALTLATKDVLKI